jgi:hypothetical protein
MQADARTRGGADRAGAGGRARRHRPGPRSGRHWHRRRRCHRRSGSGRRAQVSAPPGCAGCAARILRRRRPIRPARCGGGSPTALRHGSLGLGPFRLVAGPRSELRRVSPRSGGGGTGVRCMTGCAGGGPVHHWSRRTRSRHSSRKQPFAAQAEEQPQGFDSRGRGIREAVAAGPGLESAMAGLGRRRLASLTHERMPAGHGRVAETSPRTARHGRP